MNDYTSVSQVPSPANTTRWSNDVLMLGQRRRRWANIKTSFFQRVVFTGMGLPEIADISWPLTELSKLSSAKRNVDPGRTMKSEWSGSVGHLSGDGICSFRLGGPWFSGYGGGGRWGGGGGEACQICSFCQAVICCWRRKTSFKQPRTFWAWQCCRKKNVLHVFHVTLTTLTYVCTNHGDQRVFSICNHHKCPYNLLGLS